MPQAPLYSQSYHIPNSLSYKLISSQLDNLRNLEYRSHYEESVTYFSCSFVTLHVCIADIVIELNNFFWRNWRKLKKRNISMPVRAPQKIWTVGMPWGAINLDSDFEVIFTGTEGVCKLEQYHINYWYFLSQCFWKKFNFGFYHLL